MHGRLGKFAKTIKDFHEGGGLEGSLSLLDAFLAPATEVFAGEALVFFSFWQHAARKLHKAAQHANE